MQINLNTLTAQELRDLAITIETVQARRESIKTHRDFIADRTDRLIVHAGEIGVIDFADAEVHLPGQVVRHEGREYRNVSGLCVSVPPGVDLVVWEAITEEPVEPDEPGEDPDDPIEPDEQL